MHPSSTQAHGMKRETLPAIGACAVFTIDPVASLDPEIQQDTEVIAACKRLVNKKYVAFVDQRGFYQPWSPYNTYTVRFVLQGKPPTFPDRCIEPSMSIPLDPMTAESHPSSRDPLKVSKPLPWNDCYITCYNYAYVRTPTLVTEAPVTYRLDRAELRKHDHFLAADVIRERRLLHAKALEVGADASSTLPPDSVPGENIDQTNPGQERAHFESGALPLRPAGLKPCRSSQTAEEKQREDEAEGDDDDQTDDGVSSPGATLPRRPPSKGVITVTFTHDLSTVQELTDPAEYFKEVEAIAKYESPMN
ncbi:hypothetical protein DFH06DRAFT_653706 [Mycena polygramma]|nr:hypothetical protein DFH06DRAFT_653706 [Mycena polygramma]